MGQNFDYLSEIRTSYYYTGSNRRNTDQRHFTYSLTSLGNAQEELVRMRSATGIEGSIEEHFRKAAGLIDEKFEHLKQRVEKSQQNAELATEAMHEATRAVDDLPPEGESPFTAARELGVENVYSIMGGGIRFPDEDMRLWQESLVEEAREKEAAIARERFDSAIAGISFEEASEQGPGGSATRNPGGVPPGGNLAPPPTIAPPETRVPPMPPPDHDGNVQQPPDFNIPDGPQPPLPPNGPYDPPFLPPDDPNYNPPQPPLPPPGNENPYDPPDYRGDDPGNDGPWGPGGPNGPEVNPWDPDRIGDGDGYNPGDGPGVGGPGAGGGSGAGRFLPGIAGGAALGGAGLLAARGLGGGGLAGMPGMSGMSGAAGMGARGGAGMLPGSGLTGPGGAGAGAGAGAAGARGGTTAMVGGQGAAAGGSRGGAAMAPGGMGGAGGRGSDKKRRRKLGLQALQLEAEETEAALGPESGAGVRDSAAAPRMDTDDLF